MENREEKIRDVLLSRLPQPANLVSYREEVASLLAKNEKDLRGKRWTVVRVWVFVTVVSIPFLWMAGKQFGTANGIWFLGLACFWVLFGAIEVTKYVAHQRWVELLKEIKQVQLQVLELNALLREKDTSTSTKNLERNT